MTHPVRPMVVDLSHWDPAHDYSAVKNAGFVGVIFKASQGQSLMDVNYQAQKRAAKAVGLKWGSYHFADGSNAAGQAANYLKRATPEHDELFCLDWEDNPGGTKMNVTQARAFIETVENNLGRPGQCVLYGGNTIKEGLGSHKDAFFGARRLWLCQYSSVPVIPASWESFWLWQYTDGQHGPLPHTVPGIGRCDINSYDNSREQLIAEWATGKIEKPTPPPAVKTPIEPKVASVQPSKSWWKVW